jgi:hypothetical protein
MCSRYKFSIGCRHCEFTRTDTDQKSRQKSRHFEWFSRGSRYKFSIGCRHCEFTRTDTDQKSRQKSRHFEWFSRGTSENCIEKTSSGFREVLDTNSQLAVAIVNSLELTPIRNQDKNHVTSSAFREVRVKIVSRRLRVVFTRYEWKLYREDFEWCSRGSRYKFSIGSRHCEVTRTDTDQKSRQKSRHFEWFSRGTSENCIEKTSSGFH